ncbi:hypothetical protein LWP59_13915 [Amycolatopsis acidiphila]|nr:hypothetical protein [Amycolatopsis acidiphila]UIJ63844.1 hypothetical protein LWP59_13915 [Amycolatopsis acidiphila]
MGYPTTDEHSVPGGRSNDCMHGRIVWTAADDAITVGYK